MKLINQFPRKLSVATQSKNGLLEAADKVKIDNMYDSLGDVKGITTSNNVTEEGYLMDAATISTKFGEIGDDITELSNDLATTNTNVETNTNAITELNNALDNRGIKTYFGFNDLGLEMQTVTFYQIINALSTKGYGSVFMTNLWKDNCPNLDLATSGNRHILTVKYGQDGYVSIIDEDLMYNKTSCRSYDGSGLTNWRKEVTFEDVEITIKSGNIHETYTVPSARNILSVTILYTYTLYQNSAIAFKHTDGNIIGVIFSNNTARGADIKYKVRYSYYE